MTTILLMCRLNAIMEILVSREFDRYMSVAKGTAKRVHIGPILRDNQGMPRRLKDIVKILRWYDKCTLKKEQRCLFYKNSQIKRFGQSYYCKKKLSTRLFTATVLLFELS